jgi:hypothetical protein
MTITILSIAHMGIPNKEQKFDILGHSHSTCVLIYTRIFDPCATWVKNPLRQIEYEFIFITFFMNFCVSDWDFATLSPGLTCTSDIKSDHSLCLTGTSLHTAPAQSDLYLGFQGLLSFFGLLKNTSLLVPSLPGVHVTAEGAVVSCRPVPMHLRLIQCG